MDVNKVPVLDHQVASRTVEEQAVIVLSDSGEVTVLNPVGTRVWELIDGSKTIADIADIITGEYDAPPDAVREDVQEFLQELLDLHAITLRDPAPVS